MVEAATNGIQKQPKLAVDLLERRRPSWNKDATANQLANGRNTIAPALIVALMQAPETTTQKAAQVIDVQ